MNESTQGRGRVATADMKARVAALKALGANDIVGILWDRHRKAILGEGYTYDHATPPRAEPIRLDGHRDQPVRR